MFSSKISIKQDWTTSGKLATAHKHFNNHSELLKLPCRSLSKTYKSFMHLSLQPLHLAHAFIKNNKVSGPKLTLIPMYFINRCLWSYCEWFTHAFNFWPLNFKSKCHNLLSKWNDSVDVYEMTMLQLFQSHSDLLPFQYTALTWSKQPMDKIKSHPMFFLAP